MDSSLKSPLFIASKRLRERKENVVEQLKGVGEYVTSLRAAEDCFNSRFSQECKLIASGFSNAMEALKKRKLALFQELKQEKENNLRAVTRSVRFGGEIMSKTEEVSEDKSLLSMII